MTNIAEMREARGSYGAGFLQFCAGAASFYKEAVRDAREETFEGLAVPVVTADYLCASALQTGRPKDYLRLYSLIQAGCVTIAKLRQLIQAHQLHERWNDYARRCA